MVRPTRPEPDARSVIQIQAAFLLVLLRDFQGFLSPDTLHPFVIDNPPPGTQQGCDPLISIAAILPGQLYNISSESFFIIRSLGRSPLQSSALPQSRTGTSLCNPQFLLYKNYSLPPPLRAGQNFPVDTSFKIRLSKVRSATARLRRAFSFSSSFSLRA